MAMTWRDLLFAHWRVPAAGLARLIPSGLTLDVHEQQAWLGIVPFRMTAVRPRWCPSVPGLSAFPELNVRTYVRGPDGRPGVWFFNLDAHQSLAVALARVGFALRYLRARVRCRDVSGWIEYASERVHRAAPPAKLVARYRPTAAPARPVEPRDAALTAWLTERYCLYATRPMGASTPRAIYRGDVHHAPWSLQPAEAEFEHLDLTREYGLDLVGAPLLHFARRLDVVAWLPQRVS